MKAEDLFNHLEKKKINYFFGVPDSVLKEFVNHIPSKNKFICPNEGSAIAAATGFYLSTSKVGCVFLQNAGLGNAYNPIISIAHKNVYSIPMLLIIGWRGSPNSNDEPQHIAQGEKTITLLKTLNIEFLILRNKNDFKKISSLITKAKKNKIQVAIIIKKDFFIKEKTILEQLNQKTLYRKDVLECLLKKVSNKYVIFTNTGYTSREVDLLKKKQQLVFYNVGGMGHLLSIASFYAKFRSKKKIICIDGDGSMLMHLGNAILPNMISKNNFKYILINNGLHESVGNQPTNINQLNLKLFSKSLGFKNYKLCKSKKDLNKKIQNFLSTNKNSFFEIQVKKGTLSNLGRPQNFQKITNSFLNEIT